LAKGFPDTGVIRMASVIVDPANVVEFVDEAAFNDWLSRHHDQRNEVWVKLHKLSSGRRSITPKQAIDVVLCWGWIDAVRKGLDTTSYLQRYTPRRSKSIWSQVNVANVARLIEAGRKKKIETFVAMLPRGETVYPQKTKAQRGPDREDAADA
jgi:uncharacterized protein YdeI (YjbR/CyaY-like superfamily)